MLGHGTLLFPENVLFEQHPLYTKCDKGILKSTRVIRTHLNGHVAGILPIRAKIQKQSINPSGITQQDSSTNVCQGR